MNVRLVSALLSTFFLSVVGYAQGPCSDCFTAAEEELKRCLDNAISSDDKASCGERRQGRMRSCSNNECKVERDEGVTADESQPNRSGLSPSPGLTPHTPTKIEWLALVVNSQLRQVSSSESRYSLDVLQSDHETLLISVRYRPSVDRAMMNRKIEAARQTIMSTAKRYGWDHWVKIQERVEME